MTPLLEEYTRIQRENNEKWGDKTVVFMMVGSFYEVYEIEDNDGRLWGGAKDVSELCHIVLTRKNKNIPFSGSNPYMCGFPLYCRDRYIDRLTISGYTVVVYDQDEKTPTKRFRRMICGPLVSSGLTITAEDEDTAETISDTIHDRVGFSIMVERESDDLMIAGLVIINLTTGGVYMYEQCFPNEKAVRAFLDPLFLRYSPVEICWWGHADFVNSLKLEYPDVAKWHERDPKPFHDMTTQGAVFQKAFGRSHEDISLERHPLSATNLAGMLDFLFEHYPLLLQRLILPTWGESIGHVEYLPHTLSEMHIIRGSPSLFQLMDQTCTKMGHRVYKGVWFAPKICADTLNKMYNETMEYMDKKEIVRSARVVMKGFHDWESSIRRMMSGCFSVKRILCLWRDLDACASLGFMPEISAMLRQSLEKVFIRDHMESMNWLKPFTYDVDNDGWSVYEEKVIHPSDGLITNLMEQIGVSMDRVVIQESKDDVYATIRRMPKSVRTLENGFILRVMSGASRIYHPVWTERLSAHRLRCLEMEKLNRDRFNKTAETWFRVSCESLERLMEHVIHMDIVFSRAETVRMYNLTRPVWDGTSGISCRNLRNPIVEAVQSHVRFICNDFSLEKGKTGMLLFGQNSAGKSTYIKSIGMNVWLAQTGHFVFADEFRGCPMSRILTKLTIQDNLYRGISTFQNEMMDLRYILSRSSDGSCLVLSDELTAGTETWSATAIIAATLSELMKRPGVVFVFTTHLHTLQLYKDIYNHPSLAVAHVGFSKKGSSDPDFRRILPGEGSVMYGIEIAEDLGFPKEFIAQCFHYRKRMEDHIHALETMSSSSQRTLISSKTSRYNRSVRMNECMECGSTQYLQTHHEHQQKDAVLHPYSSADVIPGSGGQSIHSTWNLRVLCQKCHQKEHHQ